MTPLASKLAFAGTIFTSALSLFLVQPLVAKQILPWFGGSAAVWAICMVFFQIVLLAGYAYSDWIARRLAPRRQVLIHVLLLALSLAFLPIVASSHWKPTGNEDPTVLIIGLLLGTIGLPYFLLSTTGPLIQSWVARTLIGSDVYRYFSLSNLASLIALICYPLLIEPRAALVGQAYSWSVAYAAFTLLCAGSGLYFLHHVHARPLDAPSRRHDLDSEGDPTPRDYLLWLALAAMGSWLLLAIANHITQNVAAIPFLWLLPLKPDGIVAFHVTNRFLWLAPVVENIASAMGLHAVLIHDDNDNPALRNTDWVLVSARRKVLDQDAIRNATTLIRPIPGLGVWKDDFNNLFEVLK